MSTDIFKYTNIKSQENPSSGIRVVPRGQAVTQTEKDGQTDRKAGRCNEANSRFSQFCERA